MIKLSEIELVKTCSACPEQYDAFYDNQQVGYLRVRHGVFRVDFGFCGGDTIYYTDDIKGEGCFEYEEREFYLDEAKKAIIERIDNCVEEDW